jgi:hypothetical protein
MSPHQTQWRLLFGSSFLVEGLRFGRDSTGVPCFLASRFSHNLFFAGYSKKVWLGAMAFIRESSSEDRTFGRIFLITDAQFDQIVRQERGLSPDGPRICPNLTIMPQRASCYLNSDDPGRLSVMTCVPPTVEFLTSGMKTGYQS